MSGYRWGARRDVLTTVLMASFVVAVTALTAREWRDSVERSGVRLTSSDSQKLFNALLESEKKREGEDSSKIYSSESSRKFVHSPDTAVKLAHELLEVDSVWSEVSALLFNPSNILYSVGALLLLIAYIVLMVSFPSTLSQGGFTVLFALCFEVMGANIVGRRYSELLGGGLLMLPPLMAPVLVVLLWKLVIGLPETKLKMWDDMLSTELDFGSASAKDVAQWHALQAASRLRQKLSTEGAWAHEPFHQPDETEISPSVDSSAQSSISSQAGLRQRFGWRSSNATSAAPTAPSSSSGTARPSPAYELQDRARRALEFAVEAAALNEQDTLPTWCGLDRPLNFAKATEPYFSAVTSRVSTTNVVQGGSERNLKSLTEINSASASAVRSLSKSFRPPAAWPPLYDALAFAVAVGAPKKPSAGAHGSATAAATAGSGRQGKLEQLEEGELFALAFRTLAKRTVRLVELNSLLACMEVSMAATALANYLAYGGFPGLLAYLFLSGYLLCLHATVLALGLPRLALKRRMDDASARACGLPLTFDLQSLSLHFTNFAVCAACLWAAWHVAVVDPATTGEDESLANYSAADDAAECLERAPLLRRNCSSDLQLAFIVTALNVGLLCVPPVLTVVTLLLERRERGAFRRIPFLGLPDPSSFSSKVAPAVVLLAFYCVALALMTYAVRVSFWVVLPYCELYMILALGLVVVEVGQLNKMVHVAMPGRRSRAKKAAAASEAPPSPTPAEPPFQVHVVWRWVVLLLCVVSGAFHLVASGVMTTNRHDPRITLILHWIGNPGTIAPAGSVALRLLLAIVGCLKIVFAIYFYAYATYGSVDPAVPPPPSSSSSTPSSSTTPSSSPAEKLSPAVRFALRFVPGMPRLAWAFLALLLADLSERTLGAGPCKPLYNLGAGLAVWNLGTYIVVVEQSTPNPPSMVGTVLAVRAVVLAGRSKSRLIAALVVLFSSLWRVGTGLETVGMLFESSRKAEPLVSPSRLAKTVSLSFWLLSVGVRMGLKTLMLGGLLGVYGGVFIAIELFKPGATKNSGTFAAIISALAAVTLLGGLILDKSEVQTEFSQPSPMTDSHWTYFDQFLYDPAPEKAAASWVYESLSFVFANQ